MRNKNDIEPSSSGKAQPRRFVPVKHDREDELAGMELASFRRRFAAFSIDGVLIGSLFITFVVLGGLWMTQLGWIDPDDDINIGLNMDNWYSVLILAVYFATSHYGTNGQTLGKKLTGIRVVSLQHEKLGFWHCVERALGLGASALEAGFGFLQVIWKADRRATHDKIAETIVIREHKKS